MLVMQTEPNQNPPMKTCCQCQHFQPPGECYRYPPTVFASGFTRYPRVDVNQRACGEFRLPRPEPPPADTIKEELDKMREAAASLAETGVIKLNYSPTPKYAPRGKRSAQGTLLKE